MTDTQAARSSRAAGAFNRAICVALTTLCYALPLSTLATENWLPVSAAELAEDKPKLDPNAPAEVVEWRMTVDDTEFPSARKIDEYVRYKIFDPTRADSITRMSAYDTGDRREPFDVHARLTLPSGQVSEFGPKAMKERTLAKEGTTGSFLNWLNSSGVAVTEKFLAIPGIERGSVLEYHTVRWEDSPTRIAAYSLQRETVPVRKVEFVCHLCRMTADWESRTFVMNRLNGELKRDQKQLTISFRAQDIPAIVDEPFVGPMSDYAMTIINGYESYHKYLVPRSGEVEVPDRVAPKDGPWAIYATLANWFDRDRGYPTKQVKRVAAEITTGAKTDEAKAVAIHRFVQELGAKDRRHPHPNAAEMRAAESLDDVLAIDKLPEVDRDSNELMWLAIGLYTAAGLEAHTILLPDRNLARFNPNFVSAAFLDDEAIAVRIGSEWRFSAPQYITPLPFGLLPWTQEGQVGLLALDHKQEFIPVPLTPAAASTVLSVGHLALDSAGTLTGDLRRSYTGQVARTTRIRLRRAQSRTERLSVMESQLGVDVNEAEISAMKVTGLNDGDVPLVLTARIRWPGYAARTKERLIVRPSVFRTQAISPFSASERHYPVSFPYRWQETDWVSIQVPEGFAPEAPSAPAPVTGDALSCRLDLGYDRANRMLHATRTFVSKAIEVRTEGYPTIKSWYDDIALGDQHEVIFVGPAAPATNLAATEPATASEQSDADVADSGEDTTEGELNSN